MFDDNQVWKLHSDFSLRLVPNVEFKALLKQHTPTYFDNKAQVFRLRDVLSEAEKTKISFLEKQTGTPIELRLGLYKNDDFVGWSYSRQELTSTLYMQSSAIFPEFRRAGLYTELVKKSVELGTEAGFLSIFSRHVATNNAVIIAKLKLGFRITSLELTDTFGSLVHLSYFPNKTREKMLDYRAGFSKPDDEIKKLLGF